MQNQVNQQYLSNKQKINSIKYLDEDQQYIIKLEQECYHSKPEQLKSSSDINSENQDYLKKEEEEVNNNSELIKFPKNYHQKFTIYDEEEDHKQIQQQKLCEVYPWLNERTKRIQNPLLKLHNEIIDYYLEFQQTQAKHNYLLSVFSKFQGLIFKNLHSCEVMAPFFINKIYLKNTEIQIFVLFDSFNRNDTQKIQQVRNCIQKANFQKIKFFQVTTDPSSSKEYKVGFNCLANEQHYPIQIKLVSQDWMPYLNLLNENLQNNLQCKYLFFIFDTMIRQRGLENAIKSYLTCGLIAVFIHERKRQKSRSLTENLLKFLQYFGIGPFTERKITFKGKGQFQIKQDNSTNQFSFWITDKIDISSHMIREFFSLLRNRYRLISNFNFNQSSSILSALINPNKDQFRY